MFGKQIFRKENVEKGNLLTKEISYSPEHIIQVYVVSVCA